MAVGHTVLQPALDALLSFQYVSLEVLCLPYNEPSSRYAVEDPSEA